MPATRVKYHRAIAGVTRSYKINPPLKKEL